jgi:SAM-dependent methyltransferase
MILEQMTTINSKTAYPAIERDLEILSQSRNYQGWLYSLSKPFIGSRILEIGSGIGNYTKYFIRHGSVLASDSEDYYVEYLKNQFKNKNITVKKITLGNWDAELIHQLSRFNPDTIICFNVLEHVDADIPAIQDMLNVLSPGGKLVLIVPALKFLYSKIDQNYGHFRRYNQKRIKQICRDTNSDILFFRYFNFVGALGWVWSHKFLKRQSLNEGQTRLFDRIVPIISKVEKLIQPPVGLSILTVIERRDRG